MDSRLRLDQSDLLKEQVHADELRELLARLAATDTLFGEAVPTIRDVAEATDASPLLIGRILGELRSGDERDQIAALVLDLMARLEVLERLQFERLRTMRAAASSLDQVSISDYDVIPWSILKSTEMTSEDHAIAHEWDEQRRVHFTWILQAALVAFLLFVVWAFVSYRMENGWYR